MNLLSTGIMFKVTNTIVWPFEGIEASSQQEWEVHLIVRNVKETQHPLHFPHCILFQILVANHQHRMGRIIIQHPVGDPMGPLLHVGVQKVVP